MIPGPIYESLPLLYVAGGSYAFTTLESTLGLVSATALAIIGLLIARMRWQYRHDQ